MRKRKENFPSIEIFDYILECYNFLAQAYHVFQEMT